MFCFVSARRPCHSPAQHAQSSSPAREQECEPHRSYKPPIPHNFFSADKKRSTQPTRRCRARLSPGAATRSQIGRAYANLGVVYMRRKQWDKALTLLQKAEHLMPQVSGSGIRLNIGLAYFRQNEFLKAIPPFESVVRDQPDACSHDTCLASATFSRIAGPMRRNARAVCGRRNPAIWLICTSSQMRRTRAGQKSLDDRAAEQFTKLGMIRRVPSLRRQISSQSRINLIKAIAEFNAAADRNANFPFHPLLSGVAHVKKQEYARRPRRISERCRHRTRPRA